MHDAVLLINKPPGWTSFDVVNKLRGMLKVRVGHAGTLDPLASGLLIICTGKKTKEISLYQNLDKTYEGTIVIGKTTPSFDLETPFDTTQSYDHIQPADLAAVAASLTGTQLQIPPAYSAIKTGGKRAYVKARRGQPVALAPREVTVKSFELIGYNLPEVHFRITCSKGTYIRSIAADFGRKLGCGAYLHQLVRTAIGPYVLADACTIEQLIMKYEVLSSH